MFNVSVTKTVSPGGGMADAHDSKSCVARHVGSTPTPGIHTGLSKFICLVRGVIKK